MDNKPEDDTLPEAKTRPVRQLSVVWIVPIVALLAGLWMVYDTLSKRGPEITLTMANAEGIEADKTVIKVLDVNIGKVTSVNLSPDNKSVVLKARLNAGTDSLLRKDTQLWVIKPRFDKGSISGLSTLLSGVYLQLQPGKSNSKQDKFNVLSNPPVTALNVPGLRINLISRGSQALSIGDPVLYQDYPVGRVETVTFDVNRRAVIYRLFIDQPYTRLVTDNSRFWNSSGFQLKTGVEGLKFRTGPLESLISGGVSFDVPHGLPLGDPVQNMATFSLYPDQDSINEYADERHINFIALFNDSVRGLAPGAPVEYRGLRIGTVAAVPYPLHLNENSGTFSQRAIPVLLRLEIGRMETYLGKHSEGQWTKEINHAIGQGLTARLKSGNLVTGAIFVDLDFDPKTKGRQLQTIKGLPVMPTTSGGLAQIENKISTLLDKLNSLQLETTVQNANKAAADADKLMVELRQLTKQMQQLAGNPDTQRIPQKLQQTLDSMQKTMDGLSPQSPAYQDLQRSIDNLNQLLREARPVVRTINEKPSSLVFDRSVKDQQPKGAKP